MRHYFYSNTHRSHSCFTCFSLVDFLLCVAHSLAFHESNLNTNRIVMPASALQYEKMIKMNSLSHRIESANNEWARSPVGIILILKISYNHTVSSLTESSSNRMNRENEKRMENHKLNTRTRHIHTHELISIGKMIKKYENPQAIDREWKVSFALDSSCAILTISLANDSIVMV